MALALWVASKPVSSPLDASEVEALMQAIQDGRVAPGMDADARAPIVAYDLTSQDRIIRGQMPTLDAINDRIASLFGRSLAGPAAAGCPGGIGRRPPC